MQTGGMLPTAPLGEGEPGGEGASLSLPPFLRGALMRAILGAREAGRHQDADALAKLLERLERADR